MTRGWRDPLERGFAAFLVVAGIGQVLALAVWAVGNTGASLGAFARVGWMYFGAFHHVAIELDVADLEVAGSASAGATSLSLGVALLSVTAVAALLLAHAGRAVADRAGGGAVARVLRGTTVAPSYALPAFLLASVVEVRTPVRLGAFASGDLQVSLSTWQAFVFPMAIAVAAGAAGGLRSAVEARAAEDRVLRWIAAVSTGGILTFVLGVALSLAGLFVAGVAQPDGPAALLTPSTARYYRAVFASPQVGLVLLGHHVAAGPNEGVWTLVPAMGGCDRVERSESADVLCYGRFPIDAGTFPSAIDGNGVVPPGPTRFEGAPPAYFLFLLVPAIATVLGGRRAAERAAAIGLRRYAAGAAAGVVFALLVAVASLLSTVTVAYGSAGGPSAGRLTVGPDVLAGTALALAWGLVGGTIGAGAAGRIADLRARSQAASPSPAGTAPR